MSSTLRPRVDVTESIQQLVTPGANALTIGIIGVSEKGDTSEFKEFTSVSDIIAEYGSNYTLHKNLVLLAKIALEEGATRVKLLSIGTPTTLSMLGAGNSNPSVAIDAGANTITMADTSAYTTGDNITVGFVNAGFEYEEYFENITVTDATTLTLNGTDTFQFAHGITETVQEITLPIATDFTTALATLENDRDIMAVLVDSVDDTINTNLKTTIANAIVKENFMFAARGFSKETSNADARLASAALDTDNFIAVYPALADGNGKYLPGQFAAAGVIGAISGRGLPNVNYNFLELKSFGGVFIDITDFDLDHQAGLTSIEIRDGIIRVIRLATTSITYGGGPSNLLEEASVRVNVNHIKRTVQRGLERRFMTAGNTLYTRESIRTFCVGVLRKFNADGILATDERTGTPGFRDPIVLTDSENPKKVNVDLEIAPTQPLVFININFAINL
jgi:uncharacterized protein YqfB (UPF0267 family)